MLKMTVEEMEVSSGEVDSTGAINTGDISMQEDIAQEKPDRFRVTNLYDRQIRLWGWEAQQRLMKSRLLMYGMNGVGAEVLKNIMLGGIRQVTIVDSVVVAESDCSSNFFLRKSDIGSNRGTASVDKARVLNPSCTLTTVESDTVAFDEDTMKQYDLVVLNGASLTESIRISMICRRLAIPMFISQVLGFHAFFLNDLNGLQFEVPPVVLPKVAPKPPKPLTDFNGPSTSKEPEEQIICDDSEATQNEQASQLVVKSGDLESLLTKEALRRAAAASPFPKRMSGKRIDAYLNLELLLAFVERHCRYPSYHFMDKDLQELENILKEIKPAGDTRVVNPQEFLSVEANYTCAMFGGVLAQEIITVLTRRGYPVFNMYYLAACDAVGTREFIE